MDELEISGKRYISTRRAAKEYGYHSDYIGQLIRGKKLLGRKVGRSWYVELETLAAHFGKEGGALPQVGVVAKEVAPDEAPAAPVEEIVAAPTPVAYAAPAFKPNPLQIPTEAPKEKVEIKIEKNIEMEETGRDSIHIPVHVRRPSFETPVIKKAASLTYVSDDEPYVPMTRRPTYGGLSTAMVMPQSQEEVEEIYADEEVAEYMPEMAATNKKRNFFIPAVSVVALGVIALVAVMGSSVLVSSHTVIEAGKAASVGYSLQ
jgi:hypothetical protein